MRNILDNIHNQWRYPIIILLLAIIVLNAKFDIGLDKMTFKSPQENINQYLQHVDSSGPTTAGEEKTGIPLFDENRVQGDMLYKLGDKEYLVYVFIDTVDSTSNMSELEKAINDYKLNKGELPVYSLSFDTLINTDDEYLMQDAPVLLKMKRTTDEHGNVTTLISGIYHNTSEFNKHLLSKEKEKETSGKSTTHLKDTKSDTKPDTSNTETHSTDSTPKETTDSNNKDDSSLFDKVTDIFKNWR